VEKAVETGEQQGGEENIPVRGGPRDVVADTDEMFGQEWLATRGWSVVQPFTALQSLGDKF
jgi:hypothetical protein